MLMNGLKALREKRVITQEELSGASGVGVATISRLETGRVKASIKTIRALAKALGMSPEELRELLVLEQQRLL
jgi:transcriptional regulator with XRE-family HTH domain